MTPPTTTEEDDLDELPPLDGEARDPAAPEEADGAELDDSPPLAGEASLDDATGEDEPAGTEELEVDELEKGWLDEPSDARELDLGDAALADFGKDVGLTEEAPEPRDVPDEEYGFGLAPERGDLDAGDEGPLDEDEELRDEDLPALDADVGGDLDEAALVDPGFAADDVHGLPWAKAPWERVGAPVRVVSAMAVVVVDRGAIVAGVSEGGIAELIRADLEGSCQALPADGLDVPWVRALAGAGSTIEARLESGLTLVSRDGGGRFDPVSSLAPDQPTVPSEARVPPVWAACAGFEACAARRGGVTTRAQGGDWTVHPWVGIVTAIAFLDDAGTLVAATYSDADDTTALVRLDASAHAAVVARVGASRGNGDSDGRVLSMAHDEARGVLWVAGGFGVATFAVR